MIIQGILNAIAGLFNILLGAIPSFSGLDALIEYKNMFLDFIVPVFSHVLWFFNPSILAVTFAFVVGFWLFTSGEYVIKLILKYVSRIL